MTVHTRRSRRKGLASCRAGAGLLGTVLLAAPTTLRADAPWPACVPIFKVMSEFAPSGDLSGLSEQEQRNIRLYVSDQIRRGAPVPDTLYRIKRYDRDTTPVAGRSMTLILPDRNCPDQCVGTAILPAKKGVKLQDFYYRKNLVVEPDNAPYRIVKGFAYTKFKSFIFSDKDERSLLVFHEYWRTPFGRNGARRENGRVLRSEVRVASPGARTLHIFSDYYLNCLRHPSEAGRRWPGTSGVPGDPEE